MNTTISEAAKAVIRRNTAEVQGGGDFALFDQLFADDFVDHTPQPNCTPDKDGARQLYRVLRDAFPDFRAEIHWQIAEGETDCAPAADGAVRRLDAGAPWIILNFLDKALEANRSV